MSVTFDSFSSKFTIALKGQLSHEVEIGADPLGNLQRLSNALDAMSGKMANVKHQLETAKVEVTKPFPQETELSEKLERLAELNALLNMDEKGDSAVAMDDDEPENGEQIEITDTDRSEMIVDSSRSRVSVKEKLVEMSARLSKEKACVHKSSEKLDVAKLKGQV